MKSTAPGLIKIKNSLKSYFYMWPVFVFCHNHAPDFKGKDAYVKGCNPMITCCVLLYSSLLNISNNRLFWKTQYEL